MSSVRSINLIFMGMFYKGFSKELSHIGSIASGSCCCDDGLWIMILISKIRLLLIFQDLCV
jgi:hypothetical protein